MAGGAGVHESGLASMGISPCAEYMWVGVGTMPLSIPERLSLVLFHLTLQTTSNNVKIAYSGHCYMKQVYLFTEAQRTTWVKGIS